MKSKILFLMFFILIISLHSISAEIDLRITGTINDVSSIFYTETDPTSSNGYDGNDVIAPGNFPSGNSSRFYSTVLGNQLAIDSWNISTVPHALNLTFETSPVQTGNLDLSWSFSDLSYDATLYYCGTDSGCSSPSTTINMKTLSVFDTAIASSPVYFKLVIAAVTISTASCSDGIQNQGETGVDCGGPCASCSIGGCLEKKPTCTASGELTCGQIDSKTNCAGSCSSTGTKCAAGESCNGVSCVSCVPKTCLQLGAECGISDDGCGNTISCGNCPLGKSCSSGQCVLGCVPKTCSDLALSCGTTSDGCTGSVDCGACNPGYNCISGSCQLAPQCSSDDDCPSGQNCVSGSCQSVVVQCLPSCSDGYNCINGNCIEGEKPKLENIPNNLILIGNSGCNANFVCSSWSNCNVNYAVADFLNGTAVSGLRTRLCSDKNNCYSGFEEKGQCNLKEEIDVRTQSWCGQNYTEILNKITKKVIARIKTLPDGRAVNINFNVGDNQGTCAYCFDGIRDYDETGMDCGGSCGSCTASKLKRTGLLLVGTIYGYVLPLFMLFIFLSMLIYTLRFIFQYTTKIAENFLFRRYAGWKKEGYDVFVLDEDLKTIKRRL